MAEQPKWAVMRENETPMVAGTPGVSRMRFTGTEVGATALSTGITRFEPGAGLFWHIHTVDESITIIEGEPTCEIGGAGRPVESARVRPFDTVYVPAYTPHRFVNPTDRPVRILWSYPVGRIERYRVNPDGSHPADLRPGEPVAPVRPGEAADPIQAPRTGGTED